MSDALLQGGKYKIIKVLGQGGLGITYLAEQNVTIKGDIGEFETTIKVVIKEFFLCCDWCTRNSETLHISVTNDQKEKTFNKFKQQFIKESYILAELCNHHIIKIMDTFEENGTFYSVMEYCEKGTLMDRIESGFILCDNYVLRYIRQIAEALKYLHDRKICHLDIKPHNILLKKGEIVVLSDFSNANRYDRATHKAAPTTVCVTPGYAPIEQYNVDAVSSFCPTVDIYALGATLYTMVTDKTPPDALCIYEKGLPELTSRLASQRIKEAIEVAMQPNYKNRPQKIEAFMAILEGNNTTIAANDNSTASMVYIEGGSVKQDHYSYPPTQIELDNFYIGEREITQQQWQDIMKCNPSYFVDLSQPVEKVSWDDCIIFCNLLSRKEGLEECYDIDGENITMHIERNGYRLPLEAEWNYVALGGSNILRGDVLRTFLSTGIAPKSKSPEELGVYDMGLNVNEWCWGWCWDCNRLYGHPERMHIHQKPVGNMAKHSQHIWCEATFSLSDKSRREPCEIINDPIEGYPPRNTFWGLRVVRSAKI